MNRFQPFDQLTALTDVAEGTIVRVITRLDETCREVRDAARVIGDAVLMKKMEEAQMKIKRDSEFLPFSRRCSTLTNLLNSCICSQFVFLVSNIIRLLKV
jgi:DSHCT (NUC185) domain